MFAKIWWTVSPNGQYQSSLPVGSCKQHFWLVCWRSACKYRLTDFQFVPSNFIQSSLNVVQNTFGLTQKWCICLLNTLNSCSMKCDISWYDAFGPESDAQTGFLCCCCQQISVIVCRYDSLMPAVQALTILSSQEIILNCNILMNLCFSLPL